MARVIVFYTFEPRGIDLINGYYETLEAIESDSESVKTTQMSLLSMSLFSEYGFDAIFIVDKDSLPYGITYDYNTGAVSCNRTNRELRLAHNLLKLWRSGEFNKGD